MYIAPPAACQLTTPEDGGSKFRTVKHSVVRVAIQQVGPHQTRPLEAGTAKPEALKHGIAQVGPAEIGRTKIEQRSATAAYPPATQCRPAQIDAMQDRHRPAAPMPLQCIGQQQLTGLRHIPLAPALQRLQHCRVIGLRQQLSKEIQRFAAGDGHGPAIRLVVSDRLQQVAGKEEFQQRGMGKAEGALFALVIPREESGSAQVFFQLVRMQTVITQPQFGFAVAPLMKPAMQVGHRQGVAPALPQMRRKVLRQLQLVVRADVVLAAVPRQPLFGHLAIERDAVDGAAGGAVALDVGNELGHQPEGVGPLGEFFQVMHRCHRPHDLFDVHAGQGVGEITPYLILAPGQQQHGAILVGRIFAAFALREVVVLRMQRGEVLGAAGDQHLEPQRPALGLGAGTGIGHELQQVVGEDLAIGFVELDQHFVQPVEDDDGVLRDPPVYVLERVACGRIAFIQPAARHAFPQRLVQLRHLFIEPGDVSQIEVERYRFGGIPLTGGVEFERQLLAGHGLAHAVFTEQGKQRRCVGGGDPFVQVGQYRHTEGIVLFFRSSNFLAIQPGRYSPSLPVKVGQYRHKCRGRGTHMAGLRNRLGRNGVWHSLFVRRKQVGRCQQHFHHPRRILRRLFLVCFLGAAALAAVRPVANPFDDDPVHLGTAGSRFHTDAFHFAADGFRFDAQQRIAIRPIVHQLVAGHHHAEMNPGPIRHIVTGVIQMANPVDEYVRCMGACSSRSLGIVGIDPDHFIVAQVFGHQHVADALLAGIHPEGNSDGNDGARLPDLDCSLCSVLCCASALTAEYVDNFGTAMDT